MFVLVPLFITSLKIIIEIEKVINKKVTDKILEPLYPNFLPKKEHNKKLNNGKYKIKIYIKLLN